ncbi:hypothetical protein DSO57_1022981 [Entomophthora muscae]|uniref:Uncharacterized protein n=1 Tax=Entomophthora muscae TaxID=34485 RepID=A0ACC2SFQ0_9FUNG|nr:hypothetical protein DSO57_1022981 [Entomophthora muscae]
MNIFTTFGYESVSKEKLKEIGPAKVKQAIQNAFDKGVGSVDLSHIYIEKLPPEFLELRNLVWITPAQKITSHLELFMSRNHLDHFPREILDLTNLTVLIFKENKATVLPDEIGNLVNLRELSVTNNRLRYLPQTLFDLKKLDLFLGHPNPFIGLSQGKNISVIKNSQALSLRELSLRAIRKHDNKNPNIPSKFKLQLEVMAGHHCPVCNTGFCVSAADVYLWLNFPPSGQYFPFQFRFCSDFCLNSSIWRETLRLLSRET